MRIAAASCSRRSFREALPLCTAWIFVAARSSSPSEPSRGTSPPAPRVRDHSRAASLEPNARSVASTASDPRSLPSSYGGATSTSAISEKRAAASSARSRRRGPMPSPPELAIAIAAVPQGAQSAPTADQNASTLAVSASSSVPSGTPSIQGSAV